MKEFRQLIGSACVLSLSLRFHPIEIIIMLKWNSYLQVMDTNKSQSRQKREIGGKVQKSTQS